MAFEKEKIYKYIGIVGARIRDSQEDYATVRNKLLEVTEPITSFMIVSGGCKKGADRFAELLAGGDHKHIRIHYPAINSYMSKAQYRTACYDRNTRIAEDSDFLIACVAPNRKGGTEDTIKKFCKKMELTESEAIEQGILHLV